MSANMRELGKQINNQWSQPQSVLNGLNYQCNVKLDNEFWGNVYIMVKPNSADSVFLPLKFTVGLCAG